MPLPGSRISATYLFKNKLKALNTLINSAEYTIKQETVFLILGLKVLLGHINSGALNVTITSKVVLLEGLNWFLSSIWVRTMSSITTSTSGQSVSCMGR